MEDASVFKRQYMASEGIDEDKFYMAHYDEYEDDWFYIGNAIEIFCTKLGIDYSTVAEKTEISYAYKYETAYKNYQIQDAWSELENIEDEGKFIDTR